MESVSVERLDHLGVVAAVIKDLGIIEMINARVPPHDQEEITTGEAVAGMIINGLGFANRPLSLPPQFFANKSLDLLLRPGVHADLFNRFKLGRSLDEVYSYGCDLLLSGNRSRSQKILAIDHLLRKIAPGTCPLFSHQKSGTARHLKCRRGSCLWRPVSRRLRPPCTR